MLISVVERRGVAGLGEKQPALDEDARHHRQNRQDGREHRSRSDQCVDQHQHQRHDERQPLRLNRKDPVGKGMDFTDLDAMAEILWGATAP